MNSRISKYYLATILGTVLYLFYPIPESSIINANIKNTHHDFSGSAWSNYEICRPCHIPHNSIEGITPLWNHQLSSAFYQVYASSSMNSTPEAYPQGKSKLCLSCHDGTIAIENHSGTTTGTSFTGFGNVETDLRNDHPISFIYDSDLAQLDGELYDPTSAPSGLGGTIHEDLLDNGRMECSTCHDVHVARKPNPGCGGCHTAHGGTITTRSLSIRIDNSGSTFCLTCHNK